VRPAHRVRAVDQEERGVILVLVGIAMVALLTIAAIVVDLGQMRATRRESQSASDLAALAAGYYLSGHGSTDASAKPREACRAALNTIRANTANLPAATTLDCDVLPATGAAPDCTSTTLATTVTATGAYPYVVSVQYPVPASTITDSRFSAGSGANDGTQCQRMKVTLRKTNQGTFTGILGISSMQAGASSVVRASNGREAQGVAALLLLERVGCGALQTSGGGSSGSGVVVQSSGPNNPGVIMSDSAGVVGASAPVICTTNENASGYSIYGTALPAAGGGGPSITAEASSGGMAGVIGIRAVAIGGRGGAVAITGITPAPTEATVMSRTPADTKYNKPTSSGGQAQIETLHSTAYARATQSAATATTNGYRVLSSNAECNGLDTTATPVLETKIFVNCSEFKPSTAIFPNATDVIFTGKIDVANNSVLSLPVVRTVDVRGCTSSCSGGGNFAISVAGTMRVNTGGDGTTSPACSTRSGPGAGGSTTNWTKMATFGGPLLVTGSISYCQTFAYLGENASTYVRRTQAATGAAPENYPVAAACSSAYPCPSDAGGPAKVDIGGGAGTADWTSPNQLSSQPTASDFAANPFEDLALWTESSTASFLKGQGSNRTEGVFFTPNSPMTFAGQAVQSQPLNAQFISRALTISGQGTLNLKPNPDDAVVTPLTGISVLVR
jgi:Flp pilus assembly protein TadG